MTTDTTTQTVGFDGPEFLARMRERDPSAIEKLVDEHLDQIYRAARGAGLDPQQADDVTQATFATFVEKVDRFEGRSKVRTWLFGILYKKIAESRRAMSRDNRNDDIDQVFEDRFDAAGGWSRPPRSADAEFDDKELRRWILGCLDATPEQQRMAFVLREVEGLSTQEICNVLDVSSTNLGVMIHRIRNRLRECLEAKGVRG